MDEASERVALDDQEAARLRGELAMEAAGIGTFDWDLVTGELVWDERLIEMFGYDVDEFGGSIDAFSARLHPDDAQRVDAELQAAVESCGDFSSLYRVCRPDGDVRLVSARGRVLCDPDGTATRLLGAAYDITGQRGGDLGVARVLEAMPAAFYSLDSQWRFTYVNAEAERLLQRSRDELLGQVIWSAFPAAVNSLFEESYRRAVDIGRPVSFDAYYPAPLNGWYELRAWPSPDGLSVYFLEVTERRLAQEQVHRATARMEVLARASRELAGSLTGEVATDRLPRLAVPVLADACIVSDLDVHGHPHSVGSWHTAPGDADLLRRYARARHAVLPSIAVAARIITTGERAVLTGEEALAATPAGEAQDLLRGLAPTTVVGLPLRGRDRTLGLMTLLYTGGRQPTHEDLAAAEDLADRAGLALDNARLYGQQRQLAEELQRSMLTAPPEPDHAEIAVRYLPAAEAAAVGGDWYDAFLQQDGSTLLVIGDVVGHDTAAAAAMGQLRSLLRGIATSADLAPAEVLTRSDRSMALLRVGTLATALIVRIEQTPDERQHGVGRMRWASAGHLPPFLITPGGDVTAIAGARPEMLLGVDPDTRRTDGVLTLDPETTVLLYTDGLIERRDADLDTGLDRLRTVLGELAHLPLQELCDRLIERLVDDRPDDDVALVAIRLHGDLSGPTAVDPRAVPDVVPLDA